MNLYGMVGNDAINRIDLLGLDASDHWHWQTDAISASECAENSSDLQKTERRLLPLSDGGQQLRAIRQETLVRATTAASSGVDWQLKVTCCCFL